jgi:hypothetical protein
LAGLDLGTLAGPGGPGLVEDGLAGILRSLELLARRIAGDALEEDAAIRVDRGVGVVVDAAVAHAFGELERSRFGFLGGPRSPGRHGRVVSIADSDQDEPNASDQQHRDGDPSGDDTLATREALPAHLPAAARVGCRGPLFHVAACRVLLLVDLVFV